MVSGGTNNHVSLIELHSRGLTGSDAEKALDRAGITVNKNAIPFDPLPPMKAGGIRLGSPSVTTRGMKEPEMEQIGGGGAQGVKPPSETAARPVRPQKIAEPARRLSISTLRLSAQANPAAN